MENFWNQINTEEYRNVRAEAIAAEDEDMIINWMLTKPSGFENYLDTNFKINRKGLDGDYDLWLDYQILAQSMEECENLFDITSAYIQYDENGVTYNLIDPDEDLFYI
ncbi:MAG: hypothetical protein IKP86_00100, partial [Anaerolineaceae bacterium]|nr:hypothetical protein [Anaerolineaceae bacterium]